MSQAVLAGYDFAVTGFVLVVLKERVVLETHDV